MKTLPFKIDVAEMSKRINRMSEDQQLLTVENLMQKMSENIVFASDLIDLAKTVKVDIDLILIDIWMIETEPEIFEVGKKINELQKIGFLEESKVIRRNLNNQLAKIYKNLIQ